MLAQGSSSDIPHGMPLDDPQQTLDNPRRRLDECMGGAIEEYEAIVARSKGLVRGRTAWNDGRECWLVDFPLLSSNGCSNLPHGNMLHVASRKRSRQRESANESLSEIVVPAKVLQFDER